MQGFNSRKRVVIDPDERLEDAGNLAGIMPSSDGRYLAYSYGQGQSRWRDVRILEVETGKDASRIDELVPERDEAITGNSLVGGNGVGYYGGRFVLLYTKDALPLVRAFDSSGELSYELDLPDVGTIWGGFAGHSDQVARMQELQACDDPVLFKIMWGAGHTHGATPRDQAQSWADAWAFLIRALDLDLEPVW